MDIALEIPVGNEQIGGEPLSKKAIAKAKWVQWLEGYDKGDLFDSMMQTIQGAKSKCQHCGQSIYCDIVEGGGVPDWGSKTGFGGLDYGCSPSPDTGEDGTGGHTPIGIKFKKYKPQKSA